MAIQEVQPEATAVLPTIISGNIGQSAALRIHKTNRVRRKAQLEGRVTPCVICNLMPFPLVVPPGYINWTVDACPRDKRYVHRTISDLLTYSIYKGNVEMANKELREEWEVEEILPAQQVLEFVRAYDRDVLDENGNGGIVIFSGDDKPLRDKDAVVRVPFYVYEGRERYLSYSERPLAELFDEAREKMKRKALNEIQEAQNFHEQNQFNKITYGMRVWHDLAFHQKWIKAPYKWRDTQVRPEDSCEKCGEQYVSKTGVCKCGFVRSPLLAYMSSEIGIDHTRMDTLSKEDWAKVLIEEKRRNEIRALRSQVAVPSAEAKDKGSK